MRPGKHPLNLLFLVAAICLGEHVARAQTRPAAAPPVDTPNETRGMAEAGQRWERQGAQVGQYLDNLGVYTLEGGKARLAPSWKDRPVLIVTASLTCPVARRQCPNLQSLVDSLGSSINIVLLYTIDAHPKGEDSPYSPGREWVTPQNEKEGVLRAQPKTLEDRLALAREMNERLGKLAPMFVDGMDNKAWQAIGSGPNIALLVGVDGKVAAKQGWLDVEALRQPIAALLNQMDAAKQEAARAGISARPQMDAFIAALRSDDRAKIESFRATDARMWFDQKTGEGDLLGKSPWRDWDEELHARRAIESAKVQDNTVIAVSTEVNDFARLIEFPGWRATTTYTFNADGKMTQMLYEPRDVSPSMEDRFAPALEWLEQNRGEDLKTVYPNDRFAPSRESAKRWRDLLIEWRNATGRTTIDLSKRP